MSTEGGWGVGVWVENNRVLTVEVEVF